MTQQDKQQLIVWWFLWAAFQVGIFVIYFFLQGGSSAAKSPPPDSPFWFAAAAPVLISAVIRWNVLPRFQNAQAALPFFVMGIALAESTTFMGLFIFRTHQQELFALSVLGIFQFVPLFARRYFPPDDGSHDV